MTGLQWEIFTLNIARQMDSDTTGVFGSKRGMLVIGTLGYIWTEESNPIFAGIFKYVGIISSRRRRKQE